MRPRLALVLAALLAAGPGATHPAAQENDGLTRLRAWLQAVDRHQPGVPDSAATMVAGWSTDDIESLLPYMLAYVDGLRRKEVLSPLKCPSCEFSSRERTRLLSGTQRRLSRGERQRIEALPSAGSLNALLLRAAVMHADAVILGPPLPPAEFSTERRPASSSVLKSPQVQLRADDGESSNSRLDTPHWHLARALLQFVAPEPGLDGTTKLWYSATTAYLGFTSEFGQLRRHLDMAHLLFPDDADVALDLGWQFETHASPRVQLGVQSVEARLARGAGASILDVGKLGESLRNAERFLRQARDRNPGLAEASARLAHVLSLLGRHAEAEALLRALPPTSGDSVIDFYGQLQLGTSTEALGKLDEAAAAYTKALSLFPRAQSAHLAMSALADRRGDHETALVHLREGIRPAPDDGAGAGDPGDPSELYGAGQGRNLHAILAALYARVATSGPQ